MRLDVALLTFIVTVATATCGTFIYLISGENTIRINSARSSALSTATANMAHTYSGLIVRSSFVRDDIAASATLPEQTSIFRMTSSVGQGGPGLIYKMPWGSEGIYNLGSAPGWGGTVVATFGSGYFSGNSQIDLELDHNNNSGFNCPDEDLGVVGTVGCGTLLLTGAGRYQTTFGMGISGYGRIRNGVQFNSGGPVVTDLRSYSAAIRSYVDSGSHYDGVDFHQATLAHTFLRGPNDSFLVDKAGNVFATTVRTAPIRFLQLPACNAATQGMRAYVIDDIYSGFASPTAGGGSYHMPVSCNGAHWVNG